MYLSFDWENPQCAGHKLQLAINGGLKIPTITRAIAAARKLVGHFKDNTVASNQLKLRQERMEEPQRKIGHLIFEVSSGSYWKSWYVLWNF